MSMTWEELYFKIEREMSVSQRKQPVECRLRLFLPGNLEVIYAATELNILGDEITLELDDRYESDVEDEGGENGD